MTIYNPIFFIKGGKMNNSIKYSKWIVSVLMVMALGVVLCGPGWAKQKADTKKAVEQPTGKLAAEMAVNINTALGFRDYIILHLLFESGARASEIAGLELDYFNPEQGTLAILGKGNRFRQIELETKTVRLLTVYIAKYRVSPKAAYQHRLFINQCGNQLTRHGIYRLCKKYLHRALPPKRLMDINPVHSFRHSCAVNMLAEGRSVSDIRNKLGHEDIQSTMVYLQLDLAKRKKIQQQFIQYVQSNV